MNALSPQRRGTVLITAHEGCSAPGVSLCGCGPRSAALGGVGRFAVHRGRLSAAVDLGRPPSVVLAALQCTGGVSLRLWTSVGRPRWCWPLLSLLFVSPSPCSLAAGRRALWNIYAESLHFCCVEIRLFSPTRLFVHRCTSIGMHLWVLIIRSRITYFLTQTVPALAPGSPLRQLPYPSDIPTWL
ncbi:unnamed protein product [Rangifer tarandus platyrhynchus]|uniref:Uncharacterized protein n=1 Tax=Rangifer tarandus platyrhynchus TaxID=3082113 RepID=A0AC60A6I4_RANTA